jgi:hypothetical protein
MLLMRWLYVLLSVEEESGRALLRRRKGNVGSGDRAEVGEGMGEPVDGVNVGVIGDAMDAFVDEVEG